MNNIIDIHNIKTYPEELINYFESIKKYIDATNIKLNDNICDQINEILKKYYFKCVHVTRTNDINTFKKNGILRPFIVIDNSKEEYIISPKCKNALLNPLKEHISKSEYKNIEQKYNEILIKEYNNEKNKKVENWYGKYSNVCYAMDNMERIKENSIYKEMYANYGGEITKVFTDNKLLPNEILNIGKSYTIFFRLPINEICYIEYVYNHMISLYINKTSDIDIEGCINKDILVEDILEIKEIK